MRDLEVFRSPDGRHKTSEFYVEGKRCYCVAEPTKRGILITRFGEKGEVLDQLYSNGRAVDSALDAYLGSSFSTKVIDVGAYSGAGLKARCSGCNGSIVRELDSKKPGEIEEVSVIPIFSCVSCRRRFYNISDGYLRRLVEGNLEMFEKDELMERERDNDAFINTLKEYIVRIFAAKKISRLVIE